MSLRTAASIGISLAVAHPVAEQVGGLRGVAQLADVGAGVGEAERAVLVVEEQLGHPVDVVVGDDATHPQARGRARRAARSSRHVERRAAPLGGDVDQRAADELGVAGDSSTVVACPSAGMPNPAVERSRRPRAGATPDRRRRRAARSTAAGHELGEHRVHVEGERLGHRRSRTPAAGASPAARPRRRSAQPLVVELGQRLGGRRPAIVSSAL